MMQSLAQRWIEQGIEQGIEEGINKGVIKGKIQTAKELINNGIDIDIIARSTGFTKQEIEKLT
jgi:predicted transposase/invertase (TIGR01784 family)